MKICILNCQSELGAQRRGASLGINAMQSVAVEQQSNFFSRFDTVDIPHRNCLLQQQTTDHPAIDYPYAKYIDGIALVQQTLAQEVEESLARGEFPVMIGGDHSNSVGSVAGVMKYFGYERVGLVWLDAHADLHSPYTTPSGNVHGMPIAALLHEDNQSCAINTPSEETVYAWQRLKSVVPLDWKLDVEDIFYVGLRSTESQEDKFISEHGIAHLNALDAKKMGISAVAEKILQHFEQHDVFHLSFDVDSMDPSVSVGTGTPVAGGFLLSEVRELIDALGRSGKLCSFDVVEINPLLDNNNAMAKAALMVLQDVCTLAQQRGEQPQE